MISKIELLKGIHPGVYLARELQRRELRGGTLASRIGAYRQNLNAILQGRRNMNLPLSLKIEQELDLPEGFLMTLQLHYDIARTKREQYADNILTGRNFVRYFSGMLIRRRSTGTRTALSSYSVFSKEAKNRR